MINKVNSGPSSLKSLRGRFGIMPFHQKAKFTNPNVMTLNIIHNGVMMSLNRLGYDDFAILL